MSASGNLSALAEFYVKGFSLASRQAQMQKNNTTLRMMDTDDTKLGSGSAFYVTIRTHQAYSASHTFEWGMNDYASQVGYQWLISGPKTLYGSIKLDGLALAQAERGALIDVKRTEIDDVTAGFANRIEQKLWGDTTGAIGVAASVATSGSTFTITLATLSDVYNFQVGMRIMAADSAGANPKDETYVVTKLNYIDGKVVGTRENDLSTAVAANDYLYVRGDATLSIPGIPTFIPATLQSDTLLGVTRTGHGEYLQGWRVAFQGTIEATIKEIFSKMGRFVQRDKARYNVCLSYGDWLKLDDELGGRVYRTPDAAQKFGTESIQVRTPAGVVSCIPIAALKDGRAYVIDWSSWVLYRLKSLPHVVQDDGLTWLRMGAGTATPTTNSTTTSTDNLSGDGIMMRLRAWFHPLCTSPISNGTFPTA